jgi:RNA polymerase sigma-70 factor (ECF subfamily)
LAGGTGDDYQRAAEELGMEEGAVRVAVHRMRRRYRELIEGEIRRTVESPEQVDDEVRHLIAAVGA